MRLVAATAARYAEVSSPGAFLNVAQMLARWARRIVRLHRRVRQLAAFIALDRGAAEQSEHGSGNEGNPRRSKHAHLLSTARCGLVATALVTAAAGAQTNPTRREPIAQTSSAGELLRLGASGELAAYTDTNGVTVLSPSAAAKLSSHGGVWSARGNYLVDVVSAASVDIVSSASSRWSEIRHQGALAAERQLSRAARLSVTGVVSREPDYLSLGGGALLRLEPGSKQYNPTLGYSLTRDTAGRAGTPFSVYSKELAIHALSLGFEAVLDRRTVVFCEFDALLEVGDSAKPYRFLPLFGPEVAGRVQPGASLALVNQLRLPGRIEERVPGQRLRIAFFSRISRRIGDATFVAAERLYLDDWGLGASTSELKYIRQLGPRWSWLLSARGHVQSSVYFWERAYTSSLSSGGLVVPRYRTGDRELSALWVATLGLGLRYGLGPASNPTRSALGIQLDESATRFLNTLYLDGRWAHLALLQLESEF